jgi:transcription initiation factor TFIID TATA-box-binding protein
MQSPVVSNVIGVGAFDVGSKLELELIACKMEGSRLNTKKFPGIVIRKTKPKGTILLFRSGKFVIVGAQTQETSHVLSRKLLKDLKKVLPNHSIGLKSFRISNMIASGHLGYMVNLQRIAELPNAFKDDKTSGVFMRTGKVRCVVVFESGKVLLNGATTTSQIEETFQSLLK